MALWSPLDASIMGMETAAFEDQELQPGDITVVISALLEGIQRGELDASPREVEFLNSIVLILEPASAA